MKKGSRVQNQYRGWGGWGGRAGQRDSQRLVRRQKKGLGMAGGAPRWSGAGGAQPRRLGRRPDERGVCAWGWVGEAAGDLCGGWFSGALEADDNGGELRGAWEVRRGDGKPPCHSKEQEGKSSGRMGSRIKGNFFLEWERKIFKYW